MSTRDNPTPTQVILVVLALLGIMALGAWLDYRIKKQILKDAYRELQEETK